MSIIEKKAEEVVQKNENKEIKIEYRVFPEIHKDIDYEQKKIDVEVELPGVKKDKIVLKALPTWFSLSAQRENIEYCANVTFGVEIVPEKTTAQYLNGLLKIQAHIRDPLESARQIAL